MELAECIKTRRAGLPAETPAAPRRKGPEELIRWVE